MKKALVLVCILFAVKAVSGQAYIITYLKGSVYHNHKLLKLHDKLDGVAQITSNDKTAELALFSTQKGKFRLSFINSKPLAEGPAAKKSELYQMVIGNYLLLYTTEKMLTTRGDFDLQAFFNAADTGKNAGNIFLLENEMLPVKSKAMNLLPQDKFFICTIKGHDTTCSPITRNGNFLTFNAESMKGVYRMESPDAQTKSCFITHGYLFNNKHAEDRFAGPVNITFLSREYLKGLVASFAEGIDTYYKGDKEKLIADVENQLAYYYGRYFEPAVHQVLKSYLIQNN